MTCAQNPHTIACRPGFLSEIAPHVLFSSLPLHLFNLLVKSCLFYAKFSHMSSGETENTQTKNSQRLLFTPFTVTARVTIHRICFVRVLFYYFNVNKLSITSFSQTGCYIPGYCNRSKTVCNCPEDPQKHTSSPPDHTLHQHQ